MLNKPNLRERLRYEVAQDESYAEAILSMVTTKDLGSFYTADLLLGLIKLHSVFPQKHMQNYLEEAPALFERAAEEECTLAFTLQAQALAMENDVDIEKAITLYQAAKMKGIYRVPPIEWRQHDEEAFWKYCLEGVAQGNFDIICFYLIEILKSELGAEQLQRYQGLDMGVKHYDLALNRLFKMHQNFAAPLNELMAILKPGVAARHELSVCLQIGYLRAARRYEEAFELAQVAVKYDIETAFFQLGEMYRLGEAVQKDQDEALAYYESCDSNAAKYRLAVMWELGHDGGKVNLYKANSYYEMLDLEDQVRVLNTIIDLRGYIENVEQVLHCTNCPKEASICLLDMLNVLVRHEHNSFLDGSRFTRLKDAIARCVSKVWLYLDSSELSDIYALLDRLDILEEVCLPHEESFVQFFTEDMLSSLAKTFAAAQFTCRWSEAVNRQGNEAEGALSQLWLSWCKELMALPITSSMKKRVSWLVDAAKATSPHPYSVNMCSVNASCQLLKEATEELLSFKRACHLRVEQEEAFIPFVDVSLKEPVLGDFFESRKRQKVSASVAEPKQVCYKL